MRMLYLLPVEQASDGVWTPKYLYYGRDPTRPGIDCEWNSMRYGFMPTSLVLCKDITEADNIALSSHADVYVWPANIDQSIAPNDALRTFFETVNVPTDWLVASTTYRELLRCLAGMFQFAQRYQGISGRALFEGITLNSRYRDMTPQQQTWFTQTAQSLGYSLTINPNRTMRQLVKQAGDAWGTSPFYIGGMEF